ncbi:stage III sporulation protein AA [Bacillus gobiensis]|uniref:stage III sporulation protein AA n=1 Tax=Bacillus gobiensis TaxID=1441095 RepID=UPI003D23E926
MKEILEILPEHIINELNELPEAKLNAIEEIRIRSNQPVELVSNGDPYFLKYVSTIKDASMIIGRLSNYSMYTLEEELKKGYVTLRGGHRVGLAGRVVVEGGHVKGLRDISSFNIRVARQKLGISERYVNDLFENGWLNTLIIGPPQTGKTTLLRDLARLISTGMRQIPAKKVGIVDERSEIAGCVSGVPQHTFGSRLDVLDACPKAEGLMMMIRSMSPDVIIIDEIGRVEDSRAILEAMHAGVSIIVSAHGFSLQDLIKRPSLKILWENRVFDRFVELSRKRGPGSVVSILNQEGKPLASSPGVWTC